MPWAFYIFIIGLIGSVILLTVHIIEVTKGESDLLEKLRDKSDNFLIRVINFSIRKGKALMREARRRAPDTARTVVRSVRKENLRTYVSYGVGYITKGIHEAIVYILRFFGRVRKYVEKLEHKNFSSKG